MLKQDNFEDNLFLLLGRIRLIRDTVALDMDSELFLSKTLDDIDFVHEILLKLNQKLLENQRLIEKEAIFSHLSELEWQYSQVLAEILEGSGSVSAVDSDSIREKAAAYRKESLARRQIVEAMSQDAVENPKEPHLSASELNELLKDFTIS